MESPDRRAVSRLVTVLRKTTRWVQLLPFAYLVVYALVLFTEPILPDNVYTLIDAVLNVPPIVVALFLVLSRLLKLCIWHKIACLIPMLSRIVNAIDSFVITLTQSEVIAINTTLGVMTMLFIILATHKLLGHGFKVYPRRNA